MQHCRCLLAIVLVLSVCASRAVSLETFVLLYGQVTNDIAVLQQNFDSSAETRQKLATMVRVRDLLLNPAQSDSTALAALLPLLAPYTDFNGLLDTAANNIRSRTLRDYQSLGERVALLPPSIRVVRARQRYNALAPLAATLTVAQNATSISTQLQPLARALPAASDLATRADVLPKPTLRLNQVRATINRSRFVSGPSGRNSPNIFQVSAPTSLYRDVYCRVVDVSKVLTITLPAVTGQHRYDVAQGLATVSYEADVFATNRTVLNATSGTFWVQSTPTEIYGTFSCSGPGLSVTNGQFRIQAR